MRRIPKQNRTAGPILAHVDANPGGTINEICAATGVRRDAAEYNVNMLVRMQLIHISGWEVPPGRSSPSRMLEAGAGHNAPFPRRGRAHRIASQRRYDDKRRRQRLIAWASMAMGPFGVAAAQVMR